MQAALAAATAEASAAEAGWAELSKVVAAGAARARGSVGGSESILMWEDRLSSSAAAVPPPPPSPPPPPPLPPLHSVTFTHVLNPFRASSVEHRRAQALTLASIEAARRAAAARGVCVQLVAAVFPEDKGVTAESTATAAHVADAAQSEAEVTATAACALRPAMEVEIGGSLSEGLLGVAHKAKLPLLRSILLAGHAHGRGAHLIYSNIDIALQRDAYVQVRSTYAVRMQYAVRSRVRGTWCTVRRTYAVRST